MAEGILSDPQMQRLVAAEQQRQKFREHVQQLTASCWDTCVGVPGNRLDGKAEACIVNCVERFLDTSNFVINRLEKEGTAHLAQEEKARGGSSLW